MNVSPEPSPGRKGQPQPAVPPRARRSARPFIDALHLCVLTAFAVAQPVYDRLGDRPAYLADMRVGFSALVLLAVLLSLVLPLAMAGLVEGLGRVFRGTRGPLLSIAVYVLLVLFFLPVAKRVTFLPPWLMLGLALAAAGASTWAYFAFARIRSVVTVASPAVVVFPTLFLFYSPAGASYSSHLQIKTTHWRPVPVVMLVFDELRGTTLWNDAHEIDAERFPHFAELARGSSWFRNATTVYPDTWQALPSLLTGCYPKMRWIPQAADLPQNLFSVLDSTGDYELVIFEPVSRLAPRAAELESPDRSPLAQLAAIAPTLGTVVLAHLAPSDLHRALPPIPKLWFGMHEDRKIDRDRRRGVFRHDWGRDRRAQVEHFIDCLDDSPRPGLYFLHVLLPHVPWCYFPSGRRYLPESNRWELLDFNAHSDFLDFWGTDDLYVLQSQQRHVLQLTYTDQMLGRILDRLHETGLYDRCLLIVTADHGICMRTSESRRALSGTNLGDLMSVPLFVKLPGQNTAEVNDRAVESIDVLPTIVETLGIDLAHRVDGRSVFDTSLPERTVKTIFNASNEALTVPATIVRDSFRPGELRERLGPAGDPTAIYRIGPNVELLGRRVDELLQPSGQPAQIELTRAATDYSPDRDAVVPCLVEGKVLSPRPSAEPVYLAIAVNGVVQGTTRTYLLDGVRDRFSALLPESAFHVGQNDVQYYVVSGQSPALHLSPCNARISMAPLR